MLTASDDRRQVCSVSLPSVTASRVVQLLLDSWCYAWLVLLYDSAHRVFVLLFRLCQGQDAQHLGRYGSEGLLKGVKFRGAAYDTEKVVRTSGRLKIRGAASFVSGTKSGTDYWKVEKFVLQHRKWYRMRRVTTPSSPLVTAQRGTHSNVLTKLDHSVFAVFFYCCSCSHSNVWNVA